MHQLKLNLRSKLIVVCLLVASCAASLLIALLGGTNSPLHVAGIAPVPILVASCVGVSLLLDRASCFLRE